MENFKLIDTFVIYGNDGSIGGDPSENKGDCTVQVFINKLSPYNISCFMSPYGALIDITDMETSRISADGDLLSSMCDGTTLVKAIAKNQHPYAEVHEIVTNSTSCGYNGGGGGSCSLTIDEVDINDDSIEVVPNGFVEEGNVTFAVSSSEDWPAPGDYVTSNTFSELEPGDYWAFAKEGSCLAKKSFTIVESGQTALSITSVNVVNEQHEFSNDGQVTVIAESTFGPLQYSLNNSTWQSSNKFLNLAPGDYNIYVKDTKQTKSAPFVVLSFNPFINKTPSLEVADGNISRWVAVHNPLVFKFLRSDYNVISILPYPSEAAIDKKPLLILDEVPSGVVAGGYVILRAQMYKGAFKVLSVTGTNVVLDTKFVASQIGSGYLITTAKNNYRIELKVATGIGPEKEISLGTFTSDTIGLVSCQIQSKLKNLVSNRNQFAYDKINWRDLNAAASFELYYREIWDGNENAEFTKLPQAYYFTNSAKQFGDPFGSNMGDFVPFPTYPVGKPKARFLSEFKKPTYFVGYPFDLSFIYSDSLLGYDLFRAERLLDVNLQTIGTPTITVMINQDGTVLQNQDNTLILIEEGYQGFVPVSKSLGIHRLMLSNVSMLHMVYKEIELGYNDEDDMFISVTESKRIKINNDCRVKPVYLAWINTLGGWDYWLFETTQKVNLGTGNIKTYDVYIEDIKDVEGVTETISKDAADKITVGASLDIEDFKAVRGILYSPKVLMLIGQNPVKWLTVQVEQGSASYETKDSESDIEFSIILPPINIQSN